MCIHFFSGQITTWFLGEDRSKDSRDFSSFVVLILKSWQFDMALCNVKKAHFGIGIRACSDRIGLSAGLISDFFSPFHPTVLHFCLLFFYF